MRHAATMQHVQVLETVADLSNCQAQCPNTCFTGKTGDYLPSWLIT